MDPEAFSQALTQKPFRPFSIYDFSGRVYAVRGPNQANLNATKRTLVIQKPLDPETGAGGVDMLDVILIERPEIRDEPPLPENGWWGRASAGPGGFAAGEDAARRGPALDHAGINSAAAASAGSGRRPRWRR